jgi:hypothetical protein
MTRGDVRNMKNGEKMISKTGYPSPTLSFQVEFYFILKTND